MSKKGNLKMEHPISNPHSQAGMKNYDMNERMAKSVFFNHKLTPIPQLT